jgi:hypothetical protein
MQKDVPGGLFFDLLKWSMCFVLLAFLIMAPVFSGSGSGGVDIDALITELRVHVQQGNDPKASQKLTQLEERLRAGMPTTECCTYCHTDKKVNP